MSDELPQEIEAALVRAMDAYWKSPRYTPEPALNHFRRELAPLFREPMELKAGDVWFDRITVSPEELLTDKERWALLRKWLDRERARGVEHRVGD